MEKSLDLFSNGEMQEYLGLGEMVNSLELYFSPTCYSLISLVLKLCAKSPPLAVFMHQ